MKVVSNLGNKTACNNIHPNFLSIPGAMAGSLAGCMFLVCGAFNAVWHRKRLSNFFGGFCAKVPKRESLNTPPSAVRVAQKKEEEVSIVDISHMSDPDKLDKYGEESEVNLQVKISVEYSISAEDSVDPVPVESHSICFMFCTLNDNFDVGPVQCFCQLAMTSAPTITVNSELPVKAKSLNQYPAMKQQAKTMN